MAEERAYELGEMERVTLGTGGPVDNCGCSMPRPPDESVWDAPGARTGSAPQ